MMLLIAGLVLFLGMHSVRIFADDWRTAFISSRSQGAWMGMYSLVSIVGLVLIIYGYGLTRSNPIFIWHPTQTLQHIAVLLMLGSFILLAATYVPSNAIKAKVHHPMLLGVKLWAAAHLLSNGRLSEIILFGAFLVWAVVNFIVSRKRDRILLAASEAAPSKPTMSATAITIVVGAIAFIVFAGWLHRFLIGVSPIS